MVIGGIVDTIFQKQISLFGKELKTEDEEGELVKDRYKDVSWSRGHGDQLNYFWMNKGVIWTETQMHSLVWIEEGKLSIHFMRHVSNKGEDGNGNTDWGYTATGFLFQKQIIQRNREKPLANPSAFL